MQFIGHFAKDHFPDRKVQSNTFVHACSDSDCANEIDVLNFVEHILNETKQF